MLSSNQLRERARATLGPSIFESGWLYALLASLLASVIASIFPLILSGPCMIGLYSYLLGRTYRSVQHDDLSYIANKATTNVAENIVLGILINIFVFLWSLLLFIPGIVKYYSYSMAYFIKLENPQMNANDCITKSRILMEGNKMRLFMLDLSFIGWFFLSLLTLGIGSLWLTPYMQTAHAEFYKDLCENQNEIHNDNLSD